MRQIVLDTETTGLETSQDHRIIEIGCVEMINRKLTGRHYHQYINPGRFKPIESGCKVIDTLALARQKHPGQKNNLDALCKRYGVDNSQRDLHGALLDAEILADVYLLMTGGQVNLNINDQSAADSGEINQASNIRRLPEDRPALRVIAANEDELASHQQKLDAIKASSGECIWQNLGE